MIASHSNMAPTMIITIFATCILKTVLASPSNIASANVASPNVASPNVASASKYQSINYTYYSTPSSSVNFTHITIDPISGVLYVGAVNHIFQFDANLNVEKDAQTGPVLDSVYCSASTCDGVDESLIKLTKNVNKILVIDPSSRKLITCGSVHQGSCRRHELNDITKVEPLVSNPIAANDENSSTVAFVSLARYSPDRVSDVLFVGTSNTKLGPYRDLLPAISSRSLDSNSLFSIVEQSFSDSARVDISYHYRDTFIVKYVTGFSSSGFVYFGTNQKMSPLRDAEDLGIVSRLARVCDTDAGYHTYTEVTISCDSDNHRYDILSDAHLSRAGPELAPLLGIPEGDEILIGAFNTYTSGDHMKSSSSVSPSAICIYPMKYIESIFDANIHSCYNGSVETRNMDYIAGAIQKCPEVGKSGNVVSFCSETLKINGSIPIIGTPIKTYSVETLTSVTSIMIGRSSHLIVGTSSGHVKKLHIQKSSNLAPRNYLASKNLASNNYLAPNRVDAIEYEDIIVDEGASILQDMVTDRSQRHVYVASPYKIMKIPIGENSLAPILSHASSDHSFNDQGAKSSDESKYEIIRRMTTLRPDAKIKSSVQGPSSNYKPNLPPSSYPVSTPTPPMIPRRRQNLNPSHRPSSQQTPIVASEDKLASDAQLASSRTNNPDSRLFYQASPTPSTTVSPIKNPVNNLRASKDGASSEKITFLDTVPWIIFAMLIVVIVTISLIHRKQLSLWIYTKYGFRLASDKETPREGDKLFDAFLSYSLADEGFVHQILSPELEYGDAPYRLCLHYRDLPFVSTSTSGCYLGDAIVEAMEASKRSIMIISDAYLKSEWCKFDFKSAHLEVLRRLSDAKEKKKLILIFLGSVHAEDLDPDIRGWIKNCTTLQWGEKMFWDKLRYALPKITSVAYGGNSNSSSGGGSFITSGSFTRKKLHPSSSANYSSVTTIDRTLQAHLTPSLMAPNFKQTLNLTQTPNLKNFNQTPNINQTLNLNQTPKNAPNQMTTMIHNLSTTPGYKNYQQRPNANQTLIQHSVINSQTLRQTLNKSAAHQLIPSSASSSASSSGGSPYGVSASHYSHLDHQRHLPPRPDAQTTNQMMITSLDGLDL